MQGEQAEKLRKMLMAAQICAIVSLFVGGVILSCVAVGIGIAAYRRATQLVAANDLTAEESEGFIKSARWAIGAALLALALNAVSLAIWYPVMVEVMRTGDVSAIFGSTASSAPAPSSSVWG